METDRSSSDVFLDAKGLSCPMPLLKLKQSITRMLPGQWITVETTDPGSLRDIEAFCKQAGHTLKTANPSDAVYSFTIRKRCENTP